MEFLAELLRSVKRLNDAEPEEAPRDELDIDDNRDNVDDRVAEPESDLELPTAGEVGVDSEASLEDVFGSSDSDMPTDTADAAALSIDDGDELDDVAQAASDDPDRQGLIRTVANAHLVYKRQSEEGGYDELWVYNASDFRQQQQVKRAVLAGTDIPPNKTRSPEGDQTYEVWASGNVEMLLIRGLPN